MPHLFRGALSSRYPKNPRVRAFRSVAAAFATTQGMSIITQRGSHLGRVVAIRKAARRGASHPDAVRLASLHGHPTNGSVRLDHSIGSFRSPRASGPDGACVPLECTT